MINEEKHRISKRSNEKFNWKDYEPLEKIYSWLNELENSYLNVKVIVGGRTHEGRDIKGIEINNGRGLPGVVIESGTGIEKCFSYGDQKRNSDDFFYS